MIKLSDSDICGMGSRGLNFPEFSAYKYCFNRDRGRGKKITIYPEEFRTWMSKNSHDGSCISKRHSWRVIQNLCDRGFGEIIRRGFGKIELIIYSLDFVFGRKSQVETETPDPDSPKASDSDDNKKSRVNQQQLILTKKICQDAGVKFRLEKDWWEIASHGIEKIQTTIEIMYERAGNPRSPIYNLCGWFKTALRDNYYLDKSDGIAEISMLEKINKHVRNRLIELVGCVPT